MWQRTNSLTGGYFKYVDLRRISRSQEARVGAYAKRRYGAALFIIIDRKGIYFTPFFRIIDEYRTFFFFKAGYGDEFAIETETSRRHDAHVGRLDFLQLVKIFVCLSIVQICSLLISVFVSLRDRDKNGCC